MQALAELADIHYVRQGEPLGLGHAVSVARKHVGDQPFVVLLGDDIMDERAGVLEGMIETYERRGARSWRSRSSRPRRSPPTAASRPSRSSDELVRVLDIVEKPAPDEAPSNLAVMGRYVFTPEIFDAIDRVKPGEGGEIQLTDAIAPAGRGGRSTATFAARPLRHRQQARLPAGHRRAGHRARRPRARVPAFLAELVRREGLV